MAKVSVIIPVYNCDAYLAEAIDSVIKQTFEDWEIIVIDDCSDDASFQVAIGYEKKLGKEKFILKSNDENKGVAFSRNSALKVAGGEYIAFLDADDYWHENKLAAQVRLLDNNPDQHLVHTGVKVIADYDWCEENNINPSDWEKEWNKKFLARLYSNGRDYFPLLSHGDSICWSSVMVKRQLIDWIGGFDEGLIHQNEDWVFVLKASVFHGFTFLPPRFTFYRLHPSAYTTKAFLSKDKSWDTESATGQARDRCFAYMKKHSDMSSYREFDSYLSSRQKVKKNVKDAKHLVKRIDAGLRNIYHKNEHWFRPAMRSDDAIDLLILFVTDFCNLHCSHCSDRALYHPSSMTVDQTGAIASTNREMKNVLLTGGEPFIHDDIALIIRQFAINDYGGARVWINTNGFYPDLIKEALITVFKWRNHNITVTVSLDGFEDVHNIIRGSNKSYERALDSLRVLLLLRKQHPSLKVNINTTIMPLNLDSVVEFANEIAYAFDVDNHNFEVIRGDKDLTEEVICQYDILREVYAKLLVVINKRYPHHYLLNNEKFGIQWTNLVFDRWWPFTCLAGKKAMVVYPNGDLAACEMRDRIVNLNDFDWDLTKAMDDVEMRREVSEIAKITGIDSPLSVKEKGCFCTHGCWLTVSMLERYKRYGWNK